MGRISAENKKINTLKLAALRYNIFQNVLRIVTVLLISFLFIFPLLADAKDSATEPKASPLREEIQRYIGYEDLLAKYISLPYDATMHTNLWGAYIDMSFLFLMFLPLLFLFGNKERPGLNIVAMGLLLMMIIIGVPTGYSSSANIPIEQVEQHLSTIIANLSFTETPLKLTQLYIYKYINNIYQIISPILKVVSGQSDYITYPFLFALFLGIIYLINARITHHSLLTKASINVLALFSFLWLILSAGIPWYGFFILPLSLMFMIKGWSNENKGIFPNAKIKYYTFLSIVGVWLIMAFTYRTSNYNPANSENSNSLLFSVVLQYAGGQATEQQMLRAIFPQFEDVIERMNQEDKSLILRIGTFFPYFIEKNDKRLITDNQLGYFDAINSQFTDPYEMAQAMKYSGIKYIIVDLNTAQIDRTPEKSLQRKFRDLFNFIYKNEAVKLIGTDQLVKEANDEPVFSIYGQQIIKKGSFAVFEII